MVDCARHSFSSVNVPVVSIDLGHPDVGTNTNTVNVGSQAVSVVNVKHCDVHIFQVYIAGCGQCNVCGQSGSGGQNVWAGDFVTLTPDI